MYSAWAAYVGALLVIPLAACRPEQPPPPQGIAAATANARDISIGREVRDAVRHRIWRLTRSGLAVEAANGDAQLVPLPNWVWAYAEYAGCLPDVALGPSGEAVVTSNIIPTLWRVDPHTLEVTERSLALSAEHDKEIGFTGLVYSPRQDAYFAVSAVHGSLWRIDPSLRKAQRLTLEAPLRGACSVRLRPRADRVDRLTGLCIGMEEGARHVVVTPDQRAAYVRPEPCIESADVASTR
jgi:hypothetical protein